MWGSTKRLGSKIATLSALLLLGACLMTPQVRADFNQRPAPGPALRQEMAKRILAKLAEPLFKSLRFAPFHITEAHISERRFGQLIRRGPSEEFYCVFFKGEHFWQRVTAYVTVSDGVGAVHAKDVLFDDPYDYVNCGRVEAYRFPELTGRTF